MFYTLQGNPPSLRNLNFILIVPLQRSRGTRVNLLAKQMLLHKCNIGYPHFGIIKLLPSNKLKVANATVGPKIVRNLHNAKIMTIATTVILMAEYTHIKHHMISVFVAFDICSSQSIID